jgi:hypothetical protein
LIDPRRGKFVIYREIEYSITATGEPEIWQWRFQIGGMTTSGRTRTRLINMAARRVQQRIDAALRGARPSERKDDLQPDRQA